MADKDNPTSTEQYEIIFKYADAASKNSTSTKQIEATLRQSEAIEELRRLSAEIAEPPSISYTSS